MKRSEYKGYMAAGITAFCVVAAAILLFFLIFHLRAVLDFLSMLALILRPVFYGLVLAFLLLPIHRHIYGFLTAMTPNHQLEDRRNRSFLNIVAIVLSLLFAAFIVYILLAMVLPQLYTSVAGLIQAMPSYFLSVQNRILEFLQDNPEIQEAVLPYYNSATISFQEWMQSDILPNLASVSDTVAWVRVEILPRLTGMVSSVSAGVIYLLLLLKDIFIAVIISVYLLARKDIFAAQAKKIVYSLFPTGCANLLVEETRNAYRILSGFINGKLLDSLIIGILSLICCNLLKFPYPMLLAVIIGVTNIIPFFGPFIGAVPCALLILLVSPMQCVYFILFILVLQQFDGNILGPKILGDSTGLASFWVLFSILLFGGLFGFAGMVLGVPVFAMMYSIINRLVRRGLHRRGLPVETREYMGLTQGFAPPDDGEE